MTRFFNYTAIVICLGATATLAVSPRTAKPSSTAEALFANDGAFRDGLYLGKLAAKDGQPLSLAIGRWSIYQDRARFTAGYRRGYNDFLPALRWAPGAPNRQIKSTARQSTIG